MEELGLEAPTIGSSKGSSREESMRGSSERRGRRTAPPDPLLAALHGETLDAEALAQVLGLEISAVLVRLVELELHGRVVRSPGGLYRLAERGG